MPATTSSTSAAQPLGFFRKDFGKSLLRSTFHLSGPGYARRSARSATRRWPIIRRFIDFPFSFHFDFKATDGSTLVMSVDRQCSLRDRYP